MEIVINIPKSHYKALQQMRKSGLGFYHQAILNGTVLPKGHGNLVDVNDLSLMTVHIIDGAFVCSAPTIVAADVESEGESK